MAGAFVGQRAWNKTSAGAGTTQAITVVGSATAGNTIVVGFGARDTSVAGCSVADSRSNTWTIDVGPFNTGNKFGMIASTRQNTATLLNGDTITLTFGTAPNACRAWFAEEFSGLLTSAGYVDQTANAGNASSGGSETSGTTGTTSQADEVAVALVSLDGGAAITHDATYTDFPTAFAQDVVGTNAHKMGGQYKILSATGTQVCSWTSITGGASVQGMIATYKAVVAAAGVPTLSLLGVGT